ncbi:MAG: alkaline phosphatase family protein, partial [Chloroflexi bacterium]|nr:alkaline phosphatase family protein [Chloroflexota bacterium]
ITFAAQASIVTGAHPGQHWISGNEMFDRTGQLLGGKPRHFGFSVGDTLAIQDAIGVFADDLADRALSQQVSTIYERAAQQGKTSLVAHHMYGRGADRVIRPNLVDIGRFTKGKGILGLEPAHYDGKMLANLIKALDDFAPDLILAYFMGLDAQSHKKRPDTKSDYLINVLDPQIGELLDALNEHNLDDGALFVIVSDHGQIATPGDDAHSIRLGFPFDMELSPLFHALGLDLHDLPGEAPNVDAVVALNGGLAHVHLRHRDDDWPVMPRYEEDVLPVAEAFWQMNQTGKYRDELKGTLELILLRDVRAAESWQADYVAYLGGGQTQAFDAWLSERPALNYVDAVNRIKLAASHMSGDMILAARSVDGVYFGGAGLRGVHGSLSQADSSSVLTFAMPAAAEEDMRNLSTAIHDWVDQRCAAEGKRQPSIADMAPVIERLWLA